MGSALEDGFGWAAGEAAKLDWAGALALLAVGLVVAGTAVAVGLMAAYYLRHGPLTIGSGGSLAAAGVRRWHRARGTADRTRWLCARCRSWNVPSADACYRGCGPRSAVEMPLPGESDGPGVVTPPPPQAALDDPPTETPAAAGPPGHANPP
ncbi:MAG: hypothetical protein MUE82_07525 [Chloroflexi bacterium]|jgi:hypothetical protein|nr:hypothetical protein [Chloroflexota bacterium]